MNSNDAFHHDATAADRQAVLAVVLVLTAVAGLVLLWPSDRGNSVSRQTGVELTDQDTARVQTLLRAF